MSSQIFPALSGLGWSVKRTPQWKTRVQQAISGKETRVADWSYPRWQWSLTYDFLRQGTVNGVAAAEFAQLAGFFNSRQGSFDSFLYTDADDNAATGQLLGRGDGSTTTFQLLRAFGGFIEPILAPGTINAVYLDGVSQPSGWSVSSWGSAAPGVVTFAAAPAPGVEVSADFSFYFPCRFANDSLDFEKFMAALYAAKKVAFLSIK
jgi:uncharacterized protein (TIGR02217 family)